MACACVYVYVMNLDKSTYDQHTQPMLSHINVGVGHGLSIADLAGVISEAAGYYGQIEFESEKPDGTKRKLMDSCRLNNLGW